MDKLINIASSQGEQTMTSRQIAELTGKIPADVMRDCRNLDKYYVENRRTQICVVGVLMPLTPCYV